MNDTCLNNKELSDLIDSVVELEGIINTFNKRKLMHPHSNEYVQKVVEKAKPFLYIPEVRRRVDEVKGYYKLK